MLQFFASRPDTDTDVRRVAFPLAASAVAEGPVGSPYISNEYTTYHFKWYNFLPKALAQQFRRTGNQYFLFIIILMSIGTFTTIFDSPLDPTTLGKAAARRELDPKDAI
eukprot:scaffold29_cov251-Pinguiococcus_pyrenoidosus.AAC.24